MRASNNLKLSYRRETALQARAGSFGLETIFCRQSNHCDVIGLQGYRI